METHRLEEASMEDTPLDPSQMMRSLRRNRGKCNLREDIFGAFAYRHILQANLNYHIIQSSCCWQHFLHHTIHQDLTFDILHDQVKYGPARKAEARVKHDRQIWEER